MKDAKGHGSSGRGGEQSGPANSHNMPFRIQPQFGGGEFAARRNNTGDLTSNTSRTVADLRGRMQNTGPGHQAGLMQGIRNLLGGRS